MPPKKQAAKNKSVKRVKTEDDQEGLDVNHSKSTAAVSKDATVRRKRKLSNADFVDDDQLEAIIKTLSKEEQLETAN